MGDNSVGLGNSNISIWAAFMNYIFSQGGINIPLGFSDRISGIRYMLDSDMTGVINTILDYSINTASQADYTIECEDDTLKSLLNEWLQYINLEIDGVPTGIKELSKEYYKERWREGSLILAKVAGWKNITMNGTTIKVPTVIWLVNSSSIHVVRNIEEYQLGTDKYYLDEAHKIELPGEGEQITIQRPYDRWWTQYATPYLIRKGVYRNFKALEMLQEKTEEVITRFVPYLFAITKGTEKLFLEGKIDYTDEDLKGMNDSVREKLEEFKKRAGETPVWTKPFDTTAEHILPDLSKVLAEELFNQGYRAILSGLGFVDVIQGITSTRKEAVLNPAPFIEETNAGVDGFKSFLMEIIYLIVKENKIEHRKLFNRDNKLYIANTPLKINVQPIIDQIRSGFVYGAASIKTYQQSLGLDPNIERHQMDAENENGDRERFYPHITQNTEDKGIDIPVKKNKVPTTKKEVEKNVSKEKAELIETEVYFRNRVSEPSEYQKDSFKTIIISKDKGIKAIVGKKKNETSLTIQSLLFEKDKWTKDGVDKWVKDHDYAEYGALDNLEIAPYDSLQSLPDNVKKLDKTLQELWMKTWNSVYTKDKDEKKAFRISWYQVNQQKNKK
jgi:cation transport regulator ChaB